jgi:hypothetical protein
MVSKDEQYDAIVEIGELGGGPDDPNPFVKPDMSGHYPEPNGTQKLIIDQVNKNRQAEQRLSAMGFETDQVEGARSTFCLEWIINNVLSQGQRDAMTLAWAQKYGEILSTLEGRAREVVVAQRRAKLAKPQAASLIVPPGVRRPGRS